MKIKQMIVNMVQKIVDFVKGFFLVNHYERLQMIPKEAPIPRQHLSDIISALGNSKIPMSDISFDLEEYSIHKCGYPTILEAVFEKRESIPFIHVDSRYTPETFEKSMKIHYSIYSVGLDRNVWEFNFEMAFQCRIGLEKANDMNIINHMSHYVNGVIESLGLDNMTLFPVRAKKLSDMDKINSVAFHGYETKYGDPQLANDVIDDMLYQFKKDHINDSNVDGDSLDKTIESKEITLKSDISPVRITKRDILMTNTLGDLYNGDMFYISLFGKFYPLILFYLIDDKLKTVLDREGILLKPIDSTIVNNKSGLNDIIKFKLNEYVQIEVSKSKFMSNSYVRSVIAGLYAVTEYTLKLEDFNENSMYWKDRLSKWNDRTKNASYSDVLITKFHEVLNDEYLVHYISTNYTKETLNDEWDVVEVLQKNYDKIRDLNSSSFNVLESGDESLDSFISISQILYKKGV